MCRPFAGLPKTQLFNEHIDQCFSHLHFPHRERKEEKRIKGEGGGESDEETKALEKLKTHKVGFFSKDRRGVSFVPVKFNLPFHRWAVLQLVHNS